ncbi:MAG: hypothetical protein D6814_17710 [Calditrichaeota bacterium]|nr:MAG: hypothetical protein D6814_17710 [Calditrichota bacterium]
MRFESLQQQFEKVLQFFAARAQFDRKELRCVVAPYRICPLGAHVDHQGGPVLGMTINAYTLLAYVPLPSPAMQLYSVNYPGALQFDFDRIERSHLKGWGRYAVAAVRALRGQAPLQRGLLGAIYGTLPASGLSSSASAGLAYLHALADVNGLDFSRETYVALDQSLENDHLGLQNGVLDQMTISFGKKEHLLYINTLALRVTYLRTPEAMPAHRILIADSGFSRELTQTGFNSRVEECRQAARQLATMAGLPDAKILSDIPEAVFLQYREKLSGPLRRRATHFFSERQRVQDGKVLWEKGKLAEFGKLMNESCQSSIEQYQSGSPALKTLWQIVSTTAGVYGSRFSGGGYGGCVIGFVAADQAAAAVETIQQRYFEAYPEAARKARVYLAESEDGVRWL